ncbi:hypothetical protein HYH03_015004 [Edaphochlamys debaryana]|uniref:NAD dependent epimerase/dehydratase n=1 Tax=Edaphochlamys debaryana TaxID=47281 RepID=A0A835XML9_9CHLO|nr:hypothetical protein HYH03_015004 [Edaphochlamys debaryana]|eukprot:KAG2486299.1 hypothetical protein HYH03_015004 [Edaphochlamys debaryana]
MAQPRIEVIGAGFGRTGTLSLCTALDKLGYKTHHMVRVTGIPEQVSGWLQASRDRDAGRPIDWAPVHTGYTAAVDWPNAAFYKEILAANPGAKVILTVRDFDAWYESVLNTIYAIAAARAKIRVPWFLRRKYQSSVLDTRAMQEGIIWHGTFESRFEDKEFARKVYEDHIAEVKRVVPQGQLLEFSVKEGWGPLCAFLGKPVPQDEPFPNVNDTAEFQWRVEKVKGLGEKLDRQGLAGNAGIAAVAVAGAAAALVGLLRRRS